MKAGPAFAAVALLVAGAACQSIVGIEDRTFDPPDGSGATAGDSGSAGAAGGAPDAAPSGQCQDYCNLVFENCTSPNQVYKSMEACLGVCAILPPGAAGDATGNSVACRIGQAVLAKSTGEPDVHCRRAGPGGGGTCGTDCEGFCTLFMEGCEGKLNTVETCLAACAVIPPGRGYDVDVNYSENTLQCRLVHATSAVIDVVPTGSFSSHCDHAAIVSTCPCCDVDGGMAEPDCDAYCALVTTACQGEHQVYESLAQCKAVCPAFALGSAADTTPNTVGCRTYHSNASLNSPEIHCAHASAGGDGHCGATHCDGYCSMMTAFCAGTFASEAACLAECGTLVGSARDSGFALPQVTTGNTLQCRLLAAQRAAEDPSRCGAAAGIDGCK